MRVLIAKRCTDSLTGSAQKEPSRNRERSCCAISASKPPVMTIRRNVEPALRIVTRWRAMVAAKRSGGEMGEPSSRTDGVAHSSALAIMYD